MSYTPTLVSEDEVRTFFSPYLETSVISSPSLLMVIYVVEQYIKYRWYGGNTVPREDWSRAAALLLIASKLANTAAAAEKYLNKVREKFPDYEYAFTSIQKAPDSFTIQQTFEQMAMDILKSHSRTWKSIDLVNY